MVRYLIHKILEKKKFLMMNFFPRSTLEKHNKGRGALGRWGRKRPSSVQLPPLSLSAISLGFLRILRKQFWIFSSYNFTKESSLHWNCILWFQIQHSSKERMLPEMNVTCWRLKHYLNVTSGAVTRQQSDLLFFWWLSELICLELREHLPVVLSLFCFLENLRVGEKALWTTQWKKVSLKP